MSATRDNNGSEGEMVKVYEWRMGYVEVGDSIATDDGWMDELSRDGWEYVSGPGWDAGRGWICLMRREVVPGRVQAEVQP